MENILETMLEWILLYGLRVIAAIIIFVVGWFVAKTIRVIIRRIMLRAHADELLVSFVASLSYVGIMAFVIIAALERLGVQTASFVVVIGAAGLAIGFALQGSLANFAAGVLMIIFKPFKVGDYIEGGGVAGVVQQIGIFTTEMKSPDNKKVIVPNGKITSDNIINYTANDTRRVDIVAGVSYGDDIEKVKNVLHDILANDTRVLKDPAPTIGVLELADSSINFAVRPWVKTTDYWNVYFATQESIKKRFDEEGITIPFPQQDVHLYKTTE